MSKPGVNEFFSLMHYGVTFEQYSLEDMKRYGLALLKIVSTDGFSPREKWAHIELGRHVGAPDDVVREMAEKDVSKVNLAEVLGGFKDGVPARAMLYDAIVIASVDGYSDSERAMAANAAKVLGIEKNVLESIESLVESERALRKLKAALLGGAS